MRVGFGQGIITPRGGKIIIAGGLDPVRYTDKVHDDIRAVAMAVENDGIRAIWVSCDICHPTKRLTNDVIECLRKKIPGIRPEEVILSTTHATACFYLTDDDVCGTGVHIPYEKIMPLEQARAQVCEGIATAVEQALAFMQECTMEFATAHILTGLCRRVVFRNQKAEMYGNTSRVDYLRMEYPDGGATQMLYFYTLEEHRLIGIFAAVPCPAQADETSVYITGDYWNVVRERVEAALGSDVKVLAACRSAGELSPHRMLKSDGSTAPEFGRKVAENLGERIADSIIRERERPVYVYSSKELSIDHRTEEIVFPVRQPTDEDIQKANEFFESPDNSINKKIMSVRVRELLREKIEFYPAKVNVLRIADVLFFTAPMELFAEYAKRIYARFPQNPVFDVQLTNDCLGYLPTAEAIEHGGYSTGIASTLTGADGGELFVDEMIRLLQEVSRA